VIGKHRKVEVAEISQRRPEELRLGQFQKIDLLGLVSEASDGIENATGALRLERISTSNFRGNMETNDDRASAIPSIQIKDI
jgi:hypothetical protein